MALRLRPLALGVGDDREVGAEFDFAALAELDVDRLVLAVGAEQPQVHRQPAPGADLLLDNRPAEDDLARGDRVIGSLALLDPVDLDDVGRRGAGRQLHPPPGRIAALWNLSLGHGLVGDFVSHTATNSPVTLSVPESPAPARTAFRACSDRALPAAP